MGGNRKVGAHICSTVLTFTVYYQEVIDGHSDDHDNPQGVEGQPEAADLPETTEHAANGGHAPLMGTAEVQPLATDRLRPQLIVCIVVNRAHRSYA
ncbi:hypothetical protein EVAR_95330_1 [Eumeta japonica]|uniref:Uncharacterized protein n=1 Tax=Eumeta variegata TaxID=151549 RepID=A0A4C1U9Z6_EUMVA|nr:hypothetical protein EVAR_95330_1 [Eumeta japonica]